MIPILSILIENEYDAVAARQRGREIAALVGFDTQDQTRIATALSEVARNAYQYAGGGRVEFLLEGKRAPQSLVLRISDTGPGIPNLKKILDGQFKSRTGMGLGMIGARRLVDSFSVESSPAGTTVELKKELPEHVPAVTSQRLAKLSEELASRRPQDILEQFRQQNQELLSTLQEQQRTLDELQHRHEEVQRLNVELEETNRGVVALHAELEEKADRLRHADEMKSRFLSHMSHEFRTPLNAILALCKMLLDGMDGPLNPEQAKQVGYIRDSCQNLYEMVNDLLDLAKIEAGKIDVRASEFTAAGLFGTLRGIFKPLAQNEAVALVFEDASGIPPLCTDEVKLSQILRNLISNALKFTEKGEVRISARLVDAATVSFSVKDTGLGIAPEHQQRIFEEFAQVESPVQRKVKGTGLGLPLAQKLAEVLGGKIEVVSAPGAGSTFTATIAVNYGAAVAQPSTGVAACPPVAGPPHILIIDDEEVSRYVIRRALSALPCAIEEAAGADEGISIANERRPDIILLDLRMPGKNGFDALRELKAGPATRGIPVVIVTSKALNAEERAWLSQHAAAVLSKEILSQDRAPERLAAVFAQVGLRAA